MGCVNLSQTSKTAECIRDLVTLIYTAPRSDEYKKEEPKQKKGKKEPVTKEEEEALMARPDVFVRMVGEDGTRKLLVGEFFSNADICGRLKLNVKFVSREGVCTQFSHLPVENREIVLTTVRDIVVAVSEAQKRMA
ncbi:MAG TPA: hypothetical protein P5056_02380, partial [Candidatus Paceibacterota bacterium]|nr:hypothetical protein [Candidatus Paceibacterota bacterium]